MHKTRVEKLQISPTSSLHVYRAFCECGWAQDGLLTHLKRDATAAAAAHQKEVGS